MFTTARRMAEMTMRQHAVQKLLEQFRTAIERGENDEPYHTEILRLVPPGTYRCTADGNIVEAFSMLFCITQDTYTVLTKPLTGPCRGCELCWSLLGDTGWFTPVYTKFGLLPRFKLIETHDVILHPEDCF